MRWADRAKVHRQDMTEVPKSSYRLNVHEAHIVKPRIG